MQTGREEAIKLLGEVVEEILAGTPDLVRCFRKGLRACQLLQWTDEEKWYVSELWGYPSGSEIPQYRHVPATLECRTHSIHDGVEIAVGHPAEARPISTQADLFSPLTGLVGATDTGFVTQTGRTKQVRPIRDWVDIYEVEAIYGAAIKHSLESITNNLFYRCSRALNALGFSETAQAIFDEYRALVDERLAALNIVGLQSAHDALKSDNRDTWRQVGLSCRNVLYDLSRLLLQTNLKECPDPLNSTRSMPITHDKPANRILKYMAERGVSKATLKRLQACHRELFDWLSASKDPVTYEDAESCLIHTYIYLGELARRTDMKPTKLGVNNSSED